MKVSALFQQLYHSVSVLLFRDVCILLIQSLALVPGQNLYFYLNHPIKWVRLVGVIVAVDVYPTRWVLLLDDSSGAIVEITCGRPTRNNKDAEPTLPADSTKASILPDPPTKGLTATGRSISLEAVELGTVVKVKGGIGTFRDEKQLLLERISILKTTSEEAHAWGENTKFHDDVLSKPWILSKKDEEQARKKAEGLDRKERSKDTRNRALTGQSRVRQKQNNERARRVPVRQEPKRKENAVDHASRKEKEKMIRLKDKRAEERKLRERAFEELTLRKERPKPVTDIADTPPMNEAESVQDKQVSLDSPTPEEDIPNNAQMGRKEQARIRRAEERQLRELEFRRLQQREGIQKIERTVKAK